MSDGEEGPDLIEKIALKLAKVVTANEGDPVFSEGELVSSKGDTGDVTTLEVGDAEDRKRLLTSALEGVFAAQDATTEERKLVDDAKKLVAEALGGELTASTLDKADSLLKDAEQVAAKIKKDVDERRQKRKDLLSEFYKLGDPSGALDFQVAVLEKKRSLVIDTLSSGLTPKNVSEGADRFEELKTEIKSIKAVIAAKVDYLRRLDDVRSSLSDTLRQVAKEPAEFLKKEMDTVTSKGGEAKTKSDFEAVLKLLDKLAAKLAIAAKYGTLHDELSAKFEVYTAGLPTTKVTALKKLVTEAEGLSKTGDFPGAVSKLEAFQDDSEVKEVHAFYQALENLRKSDVGKNMNRWDKANLLPAKGKLNHQLQTAKAKALQSTPDFTAAKAEVETFHKRLVAMVEFTERAEQVTLLTQPPADAMLASQQSKITTALSTAKGKATDTASASTYIAAKEELDDLNSSIEGLEDVATYLDSKKSVKRSYDLLQSEAAGTPPAVHMKSLYDAAEEKANASTPKYDEAAGDLDALAVELKNVWDYRDSLADAAEACDALETEIKEKLLAPAKELAAKEKYVEAASTLADVQRQAEAALEYGRRLGEVTVLESAISDKDVKALVTDVLSRAKSLIDPGLKFQDALTTLNELQRMPTVKSKNLIIGRYLQTVAALVGRHRRVEKALGKTKFPKATKELVERLTAAQSLAETQHKYEEALSKLGDFADTLKAAEVYLDARRLALLAIDAVNSQLTVSSGNYTSSWTVKKEVANDSGATQGVVGPTTSTDSDLDATIETTVTTTNQKITTLMEYSIAVPKAPIDKLLKEGESVDDKLDFAGGTKKYRELIKEAKGLCTATAMAFEKADGGHSLDAHGPDVTQEEQRIRIQTGKRPDGKKMPTQAATTFDKIEDWVASRQAAAEKVKLKLGVDVTSTTWSPGQPTSVMTIVQHDHPIDKAVLGVKQSVSLKQSGPSQGEVGAGRTYETFVEVSGLTRTRSNFKFTPSPPSGATASITGKWVLHQQFPFAGDWDDEKKCYTSPLPD